MDPVQCDEAKQEFRVHVTSKKQVRDQLDRYGDILKTALDGQADVEEDTKRLLLQELLAVRRIIATVPKIYHQARIPLWNIPVFAVLNTVLVVFNCAIKGPVIRSNGSFVSSRQRAAFPRD